MLCINKHTGPSLKKLSVSGYTIQDFIRRADHRLVCHQMKRGIIKNTFHHRASPTPKTDSVFFLVSPVTTNQSFF